MPSLHLITYCKSQAACKHPDADTAASDGTMQLTNAGGALYSSAFSNICHFKHGKTRELHAYVADLKD